MYVCSARKRCNPHTIRQILHIVSFNNWDRCGTVIRPFTVFSSFRISDFIGIRKDLEYPASATKQPVNPSNQRICGSFR